MPPVGFEPTISAGEWPVIELIPLGICMLWSMSDEMDKHMLQREIILHVVT